MSVCLPHPVAVSAFMICRGLCACTEMLWMCVLYVSFGSKVRPRTFGCVAMGSALLFIVFPIGLDFLFKTFLLHFFLAWTSSLSISSSVISASTFSNRVLLGLPTGLLHSTLNSIYFFTQSSSLFIITCPYHLSLPLLMTVVIGSTPTSLINYHAPFDTTGIHSTLHLQRGSSGC